MRLKFKIPNFICVECIYACGKIHCTVKHDDHDSDIYRFILEIQFICRLGTQCSYGQILEAGERFVIVLSRK